MARKPLPVEPAPHRLGKCDSMKGRNKYTKRHGNIFRNETINRKRHMEIKAEIARAKAELPKITAITSIEALHPVLEFMCDNPNISAFHALQAAGVHQYTLATTKPEIHAKFLEEVQAIGKIRADIFLSKAAEIADGREPDNMVSAMWRNTQIKTNIDIAKMRDKDLRSNSTTNVQVNNKTTNISKAVIVVEDMTDGTTYQI